jgi:KDO2-lipid IV(A) lauroyltransferase
MTASGPSKPRPPALAAVDLAVAFGLPLLGAIAWALPERAWPGVARALAPFQLRQLTGDAGAVAARIGQALGSGQGGAGSRGTLDALAAENLIAQFAMLRALRPGVADRPVVLEGRAHLDAALGAGRGAVLWVGHFVHASLATKRALSQAGYALSHLSHPRHGYSGSRFGMRALNAIPRRAEDRYLAERVMRTPESALAALRLLKSRLESNRLVSLTARADGIRPVAARLFGAELALGTGAPDLAHATGAVLLPVFAWRAAGNYRVAVEPPIELAPGATRRAAAEAAAADYAARLERRIIAHPGQWLGWFD